MSSISEKGPGVVAVAAAAYVGASLIFASGYFSVTSFRFMRFFRVEDVSPLFLPTAISFALAGAILIGIWTLMLWWRPDASQSDHRLFAPRFYTVIGFIQVIGVVVYLVVALFLSMQNSTLALLLALNVKNTIDDTRNLIASRGRPEWANSFAPEMIFLLAWCFHGGQTFANQQITDVHTYCARLQYGSTQIEGAVLLQNQIGILLLDAVASEFVFIDRSGQILERRPYRPDRSLLGPFNETTATEKLLLSYSCLAARRASSTVIEF